MFFVLTFPFPPTNWPNLDWAWTETREVTMVLLNDSFTDKEKPPAESQWLTQASSRSGMGEMPYPHQMMLQILAQVSWKPWTASKPGLDCDTFGWCVLPWGCWTLFQTSHSGKHGNVCNSLRSLLSLYILYTQDWYQLYALGKLLASCWLFWLFFPRDTALEVVYVCCNHGICLLYLTCCKRLIAEFFMWRYVTCCSLVNWKSVSDTCFKWNLAHASCVSLCWVKSIWKAWLYTKKLLRLEEEFCCLPCQATIA